MCFNQNFIVFFVNVADSDFHIAADNQINATLDVSQFEIVVFEVRHLHLFFFSQFVKKLNLNNFKRTTIPFQPLAKLGLQRFFGFWDLFWVLIQFQFQPVLLP